MLFPGTVIAKAHNKDISTKTKRVKMIDTNIKV
jgi:hypothetical protein